MFGRLGSEKIRKTCVIVTRCKPEELLEHWLVLDWIREKDNNNEAYIKTTGRTFSIKRLPEEGYIHKSDFAIELSMWVAKYKDSQRVRNTLRFNEDLELHALSDVEFQEEVRVETEARKHQEEKQKRAQQKLEVQDSLERGSKKRGKKARFDWSTLADDIEQGLHVEQIAEKMGCSTAAVRLVAKKQGLKLPRKKRQKRK